MMTYYKKLGIIIINENNYNIKKKIILTIIYISINLKNYDFCNLKNYIYICIFYQ